MTIAVHIPIPDFEKDISSTFIYKCACILAAKYPHHHFIFIFDKPYAPSIITEKNITPVLMGPAIRNKLLLHYYYNFKIPRLLNKYNADYFISSDVCSLRTHVAQCMLVKDLSFLKKENLFSKPDILYLKRYTKQFVKKAFKILVLNEQVKQLLLKSNSLAENKINPVPYGIDDVYKPISYQETEDARNKYTDGKAYFLFFLTAASSGNIINVLKAFSIFKKWQKSSMQLVLFFSSGQQQPIKELSTYKHREDIKIYDALNKQMQSALIAGAYAAIHLPSIETFEAEGLKAIASAVPLISIDNDFYRPAYKDAALFTNISDKEIAEKMMVVYKDENSRNELVDKGNALAATHTWETAAETLFHSIQPLTAV